MNVALLLCVLLHALGKQWTLRPRDTPSSARAAAEAVHSHNGHAQKPQQIIVMQPRAATRVCRCCAAHTPWAAMLP